MPNFADFLDKAKVSTQGFPLDIFNVKIGNTRNEDKKNITRIYFTQLASKESNKRILKYSDINWKKKSKETNHKELFDEKDLGHKMSVFEKTVNERTGHFDYGVSDYNMSTNQCDFLVLGNGELFTFVENVSQAETKARVIRKSTSRVPEKIFLCPLKCNLFAFISNPNIFLCNLADESEIQVTNNLVENAKNIYSGSPSSLMIREFQRFIGVWWCPKIFKENNEDIYHLLYETVNEENVKTVNVSSIKDQYKQNELKYPRAFEKNPTSSLSIARIRIRDNKLIGTYSWDHTILQDHNGLEYMVRAGWTPNGDYVWTQYLDRTQTKMSIFIIPFEAFISDESMKAPIIRILYEEVGDDSWINIFNYFEFINANTINEGMIKFIYATQVNTENGNLVGYHYTSKWDTNSKEKLSRDKYVFGKEQRNFSISPTYCNLLNCDKFYYDPSDEVVYYNAFHQHPVVLRVLGYNFSKGDAYPLTKSQDIPYILERLSFKLICYCPKSKLFVIESSSTVKSVAVEVYKLDKSKKNLKFIGALTVSKTIEEIEKSMSPDDNLNYLKYPKFVENNTDGYQHQGMVFEPSVNQSLQVNENYPTIHLVYPGFKLVTTMFNKSLLIKARLFTHFGFAVFVCDTRGSTNMGMKQNKALKYKLGQTDLKDHMDFIEFAAAFRSKIDLNRLAIMGYYYGGYISLMAALKYCPNFYKCCVSDSPIVSWDLYNSIFTERYLGTLKDDGKEIPSPYTDCSALSYVKNLKKDEPRLLLTQGEGDENVHFIHLSNLITELSRRAKPYKFAFYPLRRLAFKQDEHYLATTLNFIHEKFCVEDVKNKDK